ncbi:MAG TPA: hypothetical protein VJV96_05700 [Candidatus Angelobacter sp.]|jgi:hypothetical protein|nr:hypothetical protein [Candidatus Angelobacter sp.]
MKKLMFAVFALALMAYTAPAAQAKAWTLLGTAHVDGQHDHDSIEVGRFAGRYRALQIRVNNAPIQFDHIVVHYGNGQAETLHVRDVIRPGGHSRAIALQGDRVVQSFELWYGKARPFSRRPELSLFGLR